MNLLRNVIARQLFFLALSPFEHPNIGLGAYSNSTDDEDSDAVDSEKADEQEESGWEPEHVLKVSWELYFY